MEIKEIRQIALKTGLSINYIIKDKEISKIFKILEDKIKNIVLKGETAINRVYLNEEKRFSEDIDFDIFTNKDINIIKEEVYLILKKELNQYIVEKPRIMNKTIRYVNEFNQKDKIKIEYRVDNTKEKKVDKKIINYGFVPHPSSLYPVYSIEDILDQKINAFLNRDEGKNIFNIYFILITKKIKVKNKQEVIKKLNIILKDPLKIKYYNNSTNYFISKKNRLDFDFLCKELLETLKKEL